MTGKSWERASNNHTSPLSLQVLTDAVVLTAVTLSVLLVVIS